MLYECKLYDSLKNLHCQCWCDIVTASLKILYVFVKDLDTPNPTGHIHTPLTHVVLGRYFTISQEKTQNNEYIK